MPAVSKKQQKFMGIVRSIQKGEQPASKFDKDAQDVAKDMKKKDVKKFASTKHKGLPMKKEILGKLKELIKQELSEYTYGVGDVVKDVNPSCLHYGAVGKVKEVNPKYVKFVVMNNGDKFKKGQTLEKSHDQMKKMKESVNEATPLPNGLGPALTVLRKKLWDISQTHFDISRKFKKNLEPLRKNKEWGGIPKLSKQAQDNLSKVEKNIFGESVNENKVYKVGDTVSLLSFDRRHRGRAKVKGVTKSRANKFGIKNHYITNKGTFTDMEVEGTEAFKLRFKGNTEKQVTKAMNSPYGVVLPEEVNEFSMRLQKSTQDMVDALLKIKDPMPKEIQSALIMMAKGYGLDYVKKEVQRDAKGFYKNLKQMAAAFPEFRNKPKDYKFEGVINERDYSVNSGKEYSKNFLQALELVIRQANNLKGSLAKHPIKRNINKLKAIQTLYKRFLKPVIDQSNNNYKAVDITQLKKYLQDGKFRSALEYEIRNAIDSRYMSHNHFGSLDDKQTELRKRIVSVINDLVNKMDKAQLENINENLRPSDKKILMVIATELVKTQMKGKNKNQIRKELPDILSTMGTNNFSKKSPTNRFNKNKMISLGKGFDKLSDYDKKVFINTLMLNAGLTKVESVNEAKEPDVITQLRDIVKRKTNKKIKDQKSKKTMRVDMYTASVITQVYDAVKKTSHKNKFESLPLDKMAQLSFKMIK